jgi:CheY-like chemotaxis protein
MSQPAKTVLIAEDDPVFRRVMSFSVARGGFAVECAGTGLEAYERLLQGGIDFLVTDQQMPLCTGLELLQKIADNESIQQPPTILCTAKGLELDAVALEERFELVTVVHKPFSPRKLCQMILQHTKDEIATSETICGV